MTFVTDVVLYRTADHPETTLFPYTTLFRSQPHRTGHSLLRARDRGIERIPLRRPQATVVHQVAGGRRSGMRSEEHTSELQSRVDLVCRLLLAKKNNRPVVAAVKECFGSSHR